MRYNGWVAIGLCCLGCVSASALAQDASATYDKSNDTLFNPTPREFRRPLSPDRPDATESPITLDAGAIAIEASFFDYAYDKANDDDQTVESYGIAATNLKLGLLHNTDLQIVFTPYAEEQTDPDDGPSSTLKGFGDVQMRLKINFWGNDEGDTAFGIMPFVKIPTGTELSNDEFEGGLIVPFSMELAEGVGLGLMAELDAVYNEDDDDHDLAFVHSAVLGFDIHGPLGGYLEYFGVAELESDGDYLPHFSGGFSYTISEDMILDVGAVIGLNREANDLAFFTGITWRF